MSIIENLAYNDDQITIRNYKPSDYRDTLEILKELHNMYDIGFKEKQWSESSGLRQFKPNLKRITLVAELKSTGEVICMGVIEALKDALGHYIGYLSNWATKTEFIGKQIGKILAEQAIQILYSWGCQSIRVNLGYNAPEKLITVFGHAGFTPILTILEKRIEK